MQITEDNRDKIVAHVEGMTSLMEDAVETGLTVLDLLEDQLWRSAMLTIALVEQGELARTAVSQIFSEAGLTYANDD